MTRRCRRCCTSCGHSNVGRWQRWASPCPSRSTCSRTPSRPCRLQRCTPRLTYPPYISDACLALFDEAVGWVASNGGWAVLTARSALAAGDGVTSVFDNATLRRQWVGMWSTVAGRYADHDGIAGYEVMSEPRTFLPVDVVHRAQQEACAAIWVHDARVVHRLRRRSRALLQPRAAQQLAPHRRRRPGHLRG